MFNLIIVCRNKRQAKNLAERLGAHLHLTTDHSISVRTFKRDGRSIVCDNTTDETAYFITKHDVRHGRDAGLRGIRLDGNIFDKALDKQEEDK